MKLQISFDMTDLDKAIEIAEQVSEYADIIEIGNLLLYKNGEVTISKFREALDNKTLLVNTQITNKDSEDIVKLVSNAGANWITVLAGASQNIIHSAATKAKEFGLKTMLDLIDSSSLGQSALEAKSLGIDTILFNHDSKIEEESTFADNWEMVKGNTTLPIFISANITKENIASFISFNPAGIVISKAITDADNPKEEAEYFYKIINS